MALDSTSAAPTVRSTTPTRPGRLFIIAGPAGAGKNRLMQYVIEHGAARQIPTATTRAIRPGEQEGREHDFVTPDEFRRKIAGGELLEWQEVHGNYYGMLRPTVEAALNSGETIIADIDIKGAQAAREAFPDNVVVIFLQTPTISDLIDRMRYRGESIASVGRRLLRVPQELEYAKQCDAVITNDDVERAADKLLTIIRAVLANGSPSAYCDELILYRFALHAQAIPVCGSEALSQSRAPEYPVSVCEADEQPSTAARRALQTAFPSISLPATASPADYRAPAVIDHRVADGVEIVTYSYFVPVQEKFEPPKGWRWDTITP